MKSKENSDSEEELSFLQYLKVPPPIDEMDREIHWLPRTWAKDNEIYHFICLHQSYCSLLDAVEWYGVVPFSSIVSVHHILRANYSITQFSSKLPWRAHRS